MLPLISKLSTTVIPFVFGISLCLMPNPASGDEIKNLISKINSPSIPTDGQIWIEESSATMPFHKCGTPDAEIGPKLREAVTAVVATQDGQAVRFVLGRCENQLNLCLSINSDEANSRFHTWSLQSLDTGPATKKDVSIELQGTRYFLHDVIPQSMRVDRSGQSIARIYEYKIGSLEAFTK